MISSDSNSKPTTNEEPSNSNEGQFIHPARQDYDFLSLISKTLQEKEIVENQEDYTKALHYHLLRFFVILTNTSGLSKNSNIDAVKLTRHILMHVNLKSEIDRRQLLKLANHIKTECKKYFDSSPSYTIKAPEDYLNLNLSSLYRQYLPACAQGDDLAKIKPSTLEDLINEIVHLIHIFSRLYEQAGGDESKLRDMFLSASEFCRSATKMCLIRIGEICRPSKNENPIALALN